MDMAENKLQSGYIEGMDKRYIFTYDGELLQLVPKDKDEIKPYDCFKNKNKHFDVLEGMTLGFEKIFFLNCNLEVSLSGYMAKPAGFVCFNNEERTFDVITFKSGIIDFFYHPNHIIDSERTKYNYNTGGGELRLKTFDEISKECGVIVAGKSAKLVLSVTLPGEPLSMQIDYNLGNPKSILRLVFEEKVDISEFRKIYMWIYNLMVFLNFRKDVSLGRIELGKLNEQKKIEGIAYTCLNEENKRQISNIDNIIGYHLVFEHLNELISIVNKDDLNLLFIPDCVKSDRYISAEKYMICCTSFESVFNCVFPNAKGDFNQKANDVKAEFLQYIADKREKYKGVDGKKRKEFEKYAKMIELLDFGLAEKFEYCNSKYEHIIGDYKNRIIRRIGISMEQIDDVATQFAKKRNTFIHSSLEDFEDIHIYAYALARVFIYIMILDKANIDSNMIIQAIDKIL